MSSTELLRPGIALGVYPEREDVRDSWLDRVAAAVVGSIRQHAYGRHPRYWGFIRKVDEQAEGLDGLSDPELRACVVELRRRLCSEGLEDELVARSFALIREGASRFLGMRHYDVQVFGGWVMLSGMIAEMETGEGKTLTATLPAATAALAGIPVQIITVNDFLVSRDADWMGPVYRFLGLSVGTITEEMGVRERQQAYACDITYCTNKQLVFDYLKDRLLLGEESRPLHLKVEGLYADRPRTSRLLLQGLCFAIVDEADSVLVDEARTPLIISSGAGTSEQEKIYMDAINIARKMNSSRDFSVRQRDRHVELTELGKAHVKRLTRSLGGVWSGVRGREGLVKQALSALHLFHLDKHYLIQDDSIQIVDEYTGRVMPDRSWEHGLHQMIEAKEGCPISVQQETLARISYQKFFRRYLRLSGMTGTCREVARELWSVYRLNVVTVPTNRPSGRRAKPHRVYLTEDMKWRAIVDCVRGLYRRGRPVLIGTRTVANSEHLSGLLVDAGIEHRVLNARQDREEAEIIAQAGQVGRITVATNMAGRGTDIILAEGVAEMGGLNVLATERHEARRIDRQLFGRGGRQGDPGSYQAIVSLEDDLVRELYGDALKRLLRPWARKDMAFLPGWLGALVVGLAQKVTEMHHSRIRRSLLKFDDNLGDMLAYSGRPE